jgi:hypothetical protein
LIDQVNYNTIHTNESLNVNQLQQPFFFDSIGVDELLDSFPGDISRESLCSDFCWTLGSLFAMELF